MHNIKKLKALANDNRLIILQALKNFNELNVTKLQKLMNISQSALSQHLAVLRKAGIVTTRRDSQTIFYRINDAFSLQILQILEKQP